MNLEDLETLADNEDADNPELTATTGEGKAPTFEPTAATTGEGKAPTFEPTADQRAEAEAFLDYLTELSDLEHVQYARDTLTGIFETVDIRGYVTQGQRDAVANIDEGGRRYRARRG